jgi:protein-S-isoprenylcysteine O-methyltransferase Ste14
MSSDTKERGPGFGSRLLAILILGIVAWVVLHFVISIVASIFWIVLAVVAVFAVLWAWRTLT